MKSVNKWLVCGVAAISAISATNLPLFDQPEANEELVQHPVVQAPANIVSIDDQQVPNEFFGPLYIGTTTTGMIPLKVSYDTLSEWTVIDDNKFKVISSDSQTPWINVNGDPVSQTVKFGRQEVTGPIYNESMCLIYQAELQSPNNARLCAKDMPFVYASLESDSNTYQGMLGLAHGNSKQINYVKLLHMQGKIKKPIIGLNFEDPMDDTQDSQVSFGEILYSEVEGGIDAVNFYSNLGRNQWGLRIDDFLYNGLDMTNGQKPKIALIDSASVGIQLPEFVWHNIYITMSHNAMTKGYKYKVEQATTDKGIKEIQIPGFKCKDILHELEPIQFKLEGTTIVIQPNGYTYQIDKNQDYCQIGLNPIMKESHEYRLGNMFLRNFYVALDYDKDQIMIGVNKGSANRASASIEGQTYNPYKPRPPKDTELGTGIIVLTFLIMWTIGIIYFIVEKKKLKQMHQKGKQAVVSQQEPPQLQEVKSDSADKKKTDYGIQDESLNESLTNSERLNSSAD